MRNIICWLGFHKHDEPGHYGQIVKCRRCGWYGLVIEDALFTGYFIEWHKEPWF